MFIVTYHSSLLLAGKNRGSHPKSKFRRDHWDAPSRDLFSLFWSRRQRGAKAKNRLSAGYALRLPWFTFVSDLNPDPFLCLEKKKNADALAWKSLNTVTGDLARATCYFHHRCWVSSSAYVYANGDCELGSLSVVLPAYACEYYHNCTRKQGKEEKTMRCRGVINDHSTAAYPYPSLCFPDMRTR